jgi:hypothetical protein
MSPGTENPEVDDRVLVGGNEFEIRAIIAEEDSVILAEATSVQRRPQLWVLRDAEFAPVAEGVWKVKQYLSFERPDGPEAEQ